MKKEVMKGTIIGVLVGGIIFGSVGSVAAYNLRSNQITYQPTDSAWKVNNVEDAINSLYIAKTGDNYSTEERVVGTWIDGKPVYQKVLTGANIINNGYPYDISSLNAETIVSISGYLGDNGGTPINAWVFNEWHISATVENNKIKTTTAGYSGLITIIIQYTKTTDPIPGEEQSS